MAATSLISALARTSFFFFFNDTATTEIYTLSLHDALPISSLPFIVSGLKQGWAFAWRSLITAEMLYLSLGLGQVLMMGRDLNDMSAVIAVMILIIALGYIIDGIVFKGMERHLHNKWGLTPAN